MKLNPLRWVFRSFISTANKIQAIVDAIPCKFGRHDYQLIPPDNFNIYYEQVTCTCGIIFRGLAHVRQHLKHGAPTCKFNRVCLKCKHVDLRLDRELKAVLEAKVELAEETRGSLARKILKEFNESKNN